MSHTHTHTHTHTQSAVKPHPGASNSNCMWTRCIISKINIDQTSFEAITRLNISFLSEHNNFAYFE